MYCEIACKTALTRLQGMPFRWSLDPFVGCKHGCVYWYAREYHAKRDRDIGAGFDREIEAKVNFAEALRAELDAGPKAGTVALGTGTDPYSRSRDATGSRAARSRCSRSVPWRSWS